MYLCGKSSREERLGSLNFFDASPTKKESAKVNAAPHNALWERLEPRRRETHGGPRVNSATVTRIRRCKIPPQRAMQTNLGE